MIPLQGKNKPATMEQIDEAAQDFESVFLSQMLEHMFDGIKPDDNFGGGESEEIYKSMMIEQYGKIMSRAGGIGVADYVKKEMLAVQEAGQRPAVMTSNSLVANTNSAHPFMDEKTEETNNKTNNKEI